LLSQLGDDIAARIGLEGSDRQSTFVFAIEQYAGTSS